MPAIIAGFVPAAEIREAAAAAAAHADAADAEA